MRAIAWLALLLGLWAGPVMGATVERETPLTLADVLRQVEGRYPPLAAAMQDLRLAEAERLAAEGGFDVAWRTRGASVPLGHYQQTRLDSLFELPTSLWGTTVFGGYRLGTGHFAPYDGKLETNANGELRAGATVPLWRNGPIDRRRANLSRAETGVEAAVATVTQQRLEVLRQAAVRYWDWVAAGRRHDIARQLLEMARRRDRDLEASIRLGQVPPIERLENQRAVLQREAQLVSAERSFLQAGIELSLFVRTPDGQPLIPAIGRLPVRLPEPGAAEPATMAKELEAALDRRPELRRLAAQQAQAQLELEWARNQLAPAIDLSVAGSQDLGAGSPTRTPAELEASVFLDLPLQTRQLRGRVEAADAALSRLRLQADFARDRAVADIQDAHAAQEAAYRRFALAHQERTLATKLEQAELERFKLGESTLLIVNLREQATADAAMREVDASADYQRARATLRNAMGFPPGGPSEHPRHAPY